MQHSIARKSTDSARTEKGIKQSLEMNYLNVVLVLMSFTTVSQQNEDAEFIPATQSDLLKLLEIKEKPSVLRSRSQVPKYVMDLYRDQAHFGGFTKAWKSAPGTTIRTFFRGM